MRQTRLVPFLGALFLGACGGTDGSRNAAGETTVGGSCILSPEGAPKSCIQYSGFAATALLEQKESCTKENGTWADSKCAADLEKRNKCVVTAGSAQTTTYSQSLTAATCLGTFTAGEAPIEEEKPADAMETGGDNGSGGTNTSTGDNTQSTPAEVTISGLSATWQTGCFSNLADDNQTVEAYSRKKFVFADGSPSPTFTYTETVYSDSDSSCSGSPDFSVTLTGTVSLGEKVSSAGTEVYELDLAVITSVQTALSFGAGFLFSQNSACGTGSWTSNTPVSTFGVSQTDEYCFGPRAAYTQLDLVQLAGTTLTFGEAFTGENPTSRPQGLLSGVEGLFTKSP